MVCMQAWIRVLPAYRGLHTCKPCMLRLAYVYEVEVKACIRLSCIRIRDACQGEMDVKVCIRLCRASQGLHTYMPFIFRPMHATATTTTSGGGGSSTHTHTLSLSLSLSHTHTHTHTHRTAVHNVCAAGSGRSSGGCRHALQNARPRRSHVVSYSVE
jgi:hypothetical protein